MKHLFTGGGKRLRAIMPKLVGDAVGALIQVTILLGHPLR